MTIRYAFLTLAYILGTGLSYALIPPGSAFSLLWFPNTVLLVAVLLSRPRVWAAILAIALPIHLWLNMYFSDVGAGAVLYYVFASALVLLGATIFRRFGVQDLKLVSVRQTVLFIFGSLVAVAAAARVWSPAIVKTWIGG